MTELWRVEIWKSDWTTCDKSHTTVCKKKGPSETYLSLLFDCQSYIHQQTCILPVTVQNLPYKLKSRFPTKINQFQGEHGICRASRTNHIHEHILLIRVPPVSGTCESPTIVMPSSSAMSIRRAQGMSSVAKMFNASLKCQIYHSQLGLESKQVTWELPKFASTQHLLLRMYVYDMIRVCVSTCGTCEYT